MYHCHSCDGYFPRFITPGQCPLCGAWAYVRCESCGYTDAASAFISNGNRCPGCNAVVGIPGEGEQGSFSARDTVTGVGILLLLTSFCMPFTMWDEIRSSGFILPLVGFTAAAGGVAALVWGLKGRAGK